MHLGDSLQWETRGNRALFSLEEVVTITTDEPDNPIRLPRTFVFDDEFISRLHQVFDYVRRPEYLDIEDDLTAVLNLNTGAEQEALRQFYRTIRRYIDEGRDDVWQWYIANLIQPVRLSQNPATRLVGNPPWVVYNAMADERQDDFRQQAQDRNVWAGANLATQNDLAATFVATCVDFYLRPGGKFGFVLPYAALRARQWAKFRSGEWSLPASSGRESTRADLSRDAWDFMNLNLPPFPQANSSVIFGTRLDTDGRPRRPAVPLSNIQQITNAEPVNPKMTWDEVKPRLVYSRRKVWPTAPSVAYADAFRQGATLVPQSLVVFDDANASRSRSVVYFKTERGKGDWNGLERSGDVEERFVRPAIFSKHLLPFGITGHLNIIAPFSDDGKSVLRELPQGDGVRRFINYWDAADADYRRIKKPKSPDILAGRVDYVRQISARLMAFDSPAVVYSQAGSWLDSALVSPETVIDSTLFWFATGQLEELHYLAAIFNAPALAEFFHTAGRASDRHFHSGPVRNLPIPKFNHRNRRHATLAAQSAAAHGRVAALAAERRKLTRSEVLSDAAMQPILAAIDAAVRAILPDYCV